MGSILADDGDSALFAPPVAGPSSAAAAFGFPLDPSLFASGAHWDDDSSGDSDDSLDEEDAGETDAEDEYRAVMGGGVKRAKARPSPKTSPGKGKGKGKGKGRALEPPPEDGEDIGTRRLISAIRDEATSSVGARTALEKEFDRSLEEEFEMLDDPRSRKGGKKSSKGRRAIADMEPSAEVKALLGRANVHYATGEYEAAEELLTEVVRIDPSIRLPWYTLATIQEERGNTEKAVMFKIVATHLSSAKSAAQDWAELGHQSRDIGLLQQAIYCFSQAIKGDKGDVDSMWDRAVLLKMSGSDRQAISAFTALLALIPHDPGVLRELTPLLAAQNSYAQASQLYLDAFDHFRTTVPHVTSPDQIFSFGIEDLESLADYLTAQHAYAKVVSVVKVGARWLQGREQETGWDALDDDREYDVARKQRPGWEKEARFLEQARVYPLDVRLRVRLGIARLKQDRIEEAKRHFALVLEEDVAEIPALFGAIGDAFLERKMYNDALEVFQDMCENDETNGVAVWIKVGECQLEMGDPEGAKECYEAVVEAEPENFAAKVQLAKIYEQMNEPARALGMINEVIDARRRIREAGGDADLGVAGSQARPRKRGEGSLRLTKDQRATFVADQVASEELRQREFLLAFKKLEGLQPKVDAGDVEARAEWLEVATYLVDAFRETRQLFPSDTKKKFTGVLARTWKRRGATDNDIETVAGEMATRLERSMQTDTNGASEVEETSFRGVSFDDWLTLIIKYAFLLTGNDEYEAGQETLVHVQQASVFRQSDTRAMALRFARAACAIRAHDAGGAVAALRWVWLRRQSETHPLRLLQAVLSQGVESVEALNDMTLQKFVLRQMKQGEALAKGQGAKLHSRRPGDAEEKDDAEDDDAITLDGDRFLPTKSNPVYFAGYGLLLMVSKSWQSAIIYFLRAYEITPREPLLNLCLGIAYLHRAMSRQTDNRQHQIAQGLTFLSQYRALRGPSQEVEYNFGRAFHHLGLLNYASKHYEAVLELATAARLARDSTTSDKPGEPDDFARVAAYNLSNLYLASGNSALAQTVAQCWLAV